MWLRPEVAPMPRPKGSVGFAACFQQKLLPSLNGSTGEGGLCHCPLSGSRAPKGLGSWSLLSPGRSCGLAVISHMLSSVDILPPHTSTHVYTHVHTHTTHTCRLFLAGHPSLALPGAFLTAALVLLGRWGPVSCPPQASLRLLGKTGRHSFLYTVEKTAQGWRPLCLSSLPSQGPQAGPLLCCGAVLSVTNGIKT